MSSQCACQHLDPLNVLNWRNSSSALCTPLHLHFQPMHRSTAEELICSFQPLPTQYSRGQILVNASRCRFQGASVAHTNIPLHSCCTFLFLSISLPTECNSVNTPTTPKNSAPSPAASGVSVTHTLQDLSPLDTDGTCPCFPALPSCFP